MNEPQIVGFDKTLEARLSCASAITCVRHKATLRAAHRERLQFDTAGLAI